MFERGLAFLFGGLLRLSMISGLVLAAGLVVVVLTGAVIGLGAIADDLRRILP